MISRAKFAASYPLAVEQDSVRRIEILDDPAAGSEHEMSMAPRNGRI
jgi:hypothetical protein